MMKNFKRFFSVLLIAVLTLSLFTLTACGKGEKDYTVNVKDALGNPYTSGIVVKFMQGGKQVAMQSCNEQGAATKSLTNGKYNIALQFADDEVEYYYDTDIKLTSRKNEVDVVLAYKITGEPEKLYVGADEYDAYNVNLGCTYVDLKENSRNYFLFTPTKEGNYEFSIPDGKNVSIGYYGAPHFVQENSATEVEDNKFSLSVKASMIGTDGTGTTTFVIGIDADKKAKNCVLGIERIGDAIKTIEDEPWTVYQKTVELQDYKLPAGAEIKEFDLTASTDTYKLVLNEKDGYYHLNDSNGPTVLVRLAEDSKYIASFKTMLDRSGVNKYFFDENEKFIKKESYSECLLEYIEYVDEENGVYPLTEDLKYIIQQRGEYVGWWDIENSGYMFKDDAGNNLTDINAEIAWLFMCCYVE
ncbi:MAG: hypothetical protein IJY79_05570 [Clostridia bacterium]|nr:hypothetical protein [Clostridia bacterium]